MPADGGITFPLKSHYDSVNSDIFNPLLVEADPQENDHDTLRARASPDLDARVPRRDVAEPPRSEDDPSREVVPHSAEEPGSDAAHREDGSSREAIHPAVLMPPPVLPDPNDSDDPVPITDDTWIQALKT